MGERAWDPFDFAALHGDGGGRLAFDIAAEFVVGEGDNQIRAGVVVQGFDATGLEFELGDADAVFDKENFFGATVEDVEAAVVLWVGGVPVRGRFVEFVVLAEFDGDVAEGLRSIVDDVGEVAGSESGLSVLEFAGDRIFAFDGVDDLARAKHDVHVVVVVPVHERVGVRGDVHVEDADLGVFEDELVVRLGGEFDFFHGLRGEDGGQE